MCQRACLLLTPLPGNEHWEDSGVKGHLIVFLELLQLVANDELFDLGGVVQREPVVQVPQPDDHTERETHTHTHNAHSGLSLCNISI